MTSSAPVHSSGSRGGGFAQAPTASMRSTSAASGVVVTTSVATPDVPVVQGIRTSASNIRGGVTATTTYARIGVSTRRNLPPSDPNTCACDWHDNGDGTFTCTKCGDTIEEDAYYDGHHFEGECPCMPITEGKGVWALIGALAGAYALYKARARKEQSI